MPRFLLGLLFLLLPMSAGAGNESCRSCHRVELDPAHDLGCITCHNGDPAASAKQAAHAGLTPHPAHPGLMAATCGRCHRRQVDEAGHSAHFTLSGMVNQVRRAFGATEDLASLTEIEVRAEPATALELADDLLRRRCLRCHLYSPGDDYPETRHATGCAACHLEYGDGAMQSHRFRKTPRDRECLHCHYGNRVGADFYGRFEHDYRWDYRTPFQADGSGPARPYGVEFHQLTADVHQERGLVCVDCHSGRELMATGPPPSCAGCHLQKDEKIPPKLPANLNENQGELVLTAAAGSRHPVPRRLHPAHGEFGKVDCLVCHARWSFDDRGTHLLRDDSGNFEPWEPLTVQGSSQVEFILSRNLFGFSDDEVPGQMTDGIDGRPRPGLWYQGFGQRRWENMVVDQDRDGVLRVHRPLLDLHLSWVDKDGKTVFDSISPSNPAAAQRPYTPHTVGRAGLFYQQRLVDGMRTED